MAKPTPSDTPLTDILKRAEENSAHAQPPEGGYPAEDDYDESPLSGAAEHDLEGMAEAVRDFAAGDYVNVTIDPSAGTVLHVAHGEAPNLSALGQLAVEFGPTNEFSERRRAALEDEAAQLADAIRQIDAQIAHLNARRTDAMLAYSGISADMRALERDRE